MSKHTPLPWATEERLPHVWTIFPEGKMPIGCIHPQTAHVNPEDDEPAGVATAQANADFVVRAVNCHEELLAACKLLSEWADTNHSGTFDAAVEAAIAAVAKVEGRDA